MIDHESFKAISYAFVSTFIVDFFWIKRCQWFDSSLTSCHEASVHLCS